MEPRGRPEKQKTLLETAGFTVSSTAMQKIIVLQNYNWRKVHSGQRLLDALSTALGKTYVVGTNETIATSSADSVVVTIGSSKK